MVMASLARGNSKGVPWFCLNLKRIADPLSLLDYVGAELCWH